MLKCPSLSTAVEVGEFSRCTLPKPPAFGSGLGGGLAFTCRGLRCSLTLLCVQPLNNDTTGLTARWPSLYLCRTLMWALFAHPRHIWGPKGFSACIVTRRTRLREEVFQTSLLPKITPSSHLAAGLWRALRQLLQSQGYSPGRESPHPLPTRAALPSPHLPSQTPPP